MKPCIVLLAVLFCLPACKETAEALANSKTSASLVGNWKVSAYYENGTDRTNDFNNLWGVYRIEFDVAGNYIETAQPAGIYVTVAGPWQVSGGGTQLTLTNKQDNSKRYYTIVSVTATKAIVKEGSDKEFHFVKI